MERKKHCLLIIVKNLMYTSFQNLLVFNITVYSGECL